MSEPDKFLRHFTPLDQEKILELQKTINEANAMMVSANLRGLSNEEYLEETLDQLDKLRRAADDLETVLEKMPEEAKAE